MLYSGVLLRRSVLMSEKRRDNKGRVLRTGESQRKDGRYVYKYLDSEGKSHFVYSWRLVSTDKIPAGAREDLPLRDKEKQIQKDKEDGIVYTQQKMTVQQLYQRAILDPNKDRLNTRESKEYCFRIIQEDPISQYEIDKVKPYDAKNFILRIGNHGYAFGTISMVYRRIKFSFACAVEDDLIRKNPFNFKINSLIRNDTKEKIALTDEEASRFLSFIREDKVYNKYYNMISILLGTGIRISELLGLTTNIDLGNRALIIDHQLLYSSKNGYYISRPKTQKGIRKIPMTEEVYQCIKKQIDMVQKINNPFCVEGYSGFLFIKRDGLPMTRCGIKTMLASAQKKYNSRHDEPLPWITPHILRHTFCTRLANKGMNPKSLQYVMGHSSVSITLDYYTHFTYESIQDEMFRIENASIRGGNFTTDFTTNDDGDII